MKNKSTIKDVANRAGVSVGTVSNVLNKTRAVSDRKAALVIQAVRDLDFQFDPMAQNLRRGSSRTIGLCTTFAAPALLSAIAEALERTSEARGFDTMIAMSWQEPERELRRIRTMVRNRVDGIFFMPSGAPQAALDFLVESGMPTVILERPTGDARFDHVVVDQVDLSRRIVELLAQEGRRRILFVPQRAWINISRIRADAMSEAATRCGAQYDLLERGEDFVAFARAIGGIFRGPTPPDAVVVGNSDVAIWLLKAVNEAAPRWRDRGRLVTFDNPDWAALLLPPIASVQFPIQRMVDAAWEHLEARMGGASGPGRTTVLRGEFRL